MSDPNNNRLVIHVFDLPQGFADARVLQERLPAVTAKVLDHPLIYNALSCGDGNMPKHDPRRSINQLVDIRLHACPWNGPSERVIEVQYGRPTWIPDNLFQALTDAVYHEVSTVVFRYLGSSGYTRKDWVTSPPLPFEP